MNNAKNIFKEANISYWSKRACTYSVVNQEELATDQHSVWRDTIDHKIKANFPGIPAKDIRVLDIGTGPGFFAIILAELGYNVTAVDYTQNMLEEAKCNAGVLAGRINFQQMNAEELSFDDESFDVIVSRNLTWNLHNPDMAYRHWTRVLKQNGLLLNFDANWYCYLYDDMAKKAHDRDRENVYAMDVEDDTAGTNVDAMEAIARQTPLASRKRPEWDIDVLGNLGMNITTDTEIWKQVWTKTEWINNASTPMFLVQATKYC